MIDREKVIKACECCNPFNRKCKECPYEKDCYHDGISRHMVADALALLKEQEERWIPVTERLPKEDTDILVYCTDGEESRIVAVNYANGVWFDCVFNTVMVVENITHWMPLPKPPKEGR